MAPTIPIDYTGQRESKKLLKTGSSDMMGKTRKVSKAYPSGFVPGYRHAVDTTADPEGLGSSGRVNTKLAASEDSSALKRKCISLNMDGNGRFGGQMRVFYLSQMSHSERRDLGVRLKTELEQVRMLQRKIASLGLEPLGRPPYTDTSRSQNRSMRPSSAEPSRVENRPTSMKDVTGAPGKGKAPPGRNGPRTLGGLTAGRKTESVKQGLPQNTNFAMLMKQCQTLLTRMMSHKHAPIFNVPVDIVKHNIPDYFNIIKYPMDLGTVKKKLLSGAYSNPMQFAADVRLTFKNAVTYNPAGHEVHIMALNLSEYFEMRWKPIEKKIPSTADESTASKLSVVIEPPRTNMPPVKKQKTTNIENKVKQDMDKRLMSDSEKLKLSVEVDKRLMSDSEREKLGLEVEALLGELPDKIIEFLQRNCMNGGSQVSEDEIEIDIDSLSDDTLFILRKLMDDYLLEKKKNQLRAEPCEIEIRNEPGVSNLSVQPQKENDLVDENVDIGEDDPPPIYSSTPVEIEKDATRRNSSCSSSSSSSSESGSSSSDSGSSSAAELDGAKNSVPMSTETAGPRAEKETDPGNPNSEELRKGSTERISPSNSSSMEPNCCQEGESGPPDRHVSPEKLYRAALLRSRYADIIIKAQENTSEKGEKPDPEKLKIEREEIERRRKEEKARLQAEAKAAEEARKRAEEEAAAEAKRKIELEREAARQALQQMEKTVDINENSQFMEDLEMFTAAPDENIQNFVEVASPEKSQNGLGSFKFQANSNPLELLGLYMKNDEEEEEEVEPKSIPNTSDDPEEGEID